MGLITGSSVERIEERVVYDMIALFRIYDFRKSPLWSPPRLPYDQRRAGFLHPGRYFRYSPTKRLVTNDSSPTESGQAVIVIVHCDCALRFTAHSRRPAPATSRHAAPPSRGSCPPHRSLTGVVHHTGKKDRAAQAFADEEHERPVELVAGWHRDHDCAHDGHGRCT